jgi:hypothetical protein
MAIAGDEVKFQPLLDGSQIRGYLAGRPLREENMYGE